MNTFAATDSLVVTIVKGGKACFSMNLDGLSSLGDVLRMVRMVHPGLTGLLTLRLRNRTQGWTVDRPLLFKASRPVAAEPSAPRRGRKGGDAYPSLFDGVL